MLRVSFSAFNQERRPFRCRDIQRSPSDCAEVVDACAGRASFESELANAAQATIDDRVVVESPAARGFLAQE
jgi:hypothetical protein